MGITIVDASGLAGNQVFVSKYTNQNNGSDSWYDINTASQSWSRGPGWELVAFGSTANDPRRGWYVKIEPGKTLNIIFYGFDRDLGLQYA